MLKVLLVDDDIEFRNNLRKNTDWIAAGCEVVEELSDGERAYTYVNTEHPDIVITDLQMPYMDGLTLSRLIKEEYQDIEIIMVTSSIDFSCVQYAMHIGISDYILKPVDGEELRNAISKAAGSVNSRHSIEEMLEGYVRDKEKDIIHDRNGIFDELAFSRKSPAEIIELAKEYDIALAAMCYSVMLINVVPMGFNTDDSKNTLEAIDYEIRELAENSGVIIFDREIYGKGLILKADNEKNMTEQREVFIEQVKNILYKYDYTKFYGGVGTTVNRLGDMHLSYEKAFHAYAQSYVLNENIIIDSNEMEYGVYIADDDFHISDIDIGRIDRSKVYKYLRFGEVDKVTEFVDGLFEDMGEEALNSNTFRRYYIVDIFFCVCEFLEGLGYNREEIESPDITFEILQNRENSRKYVINILEKAMSFREKSSKGRYGDIVNEVMGYIDENYADDKLSLNVLATHVNFSPNHLSMLFSQQTGITFIKYLTDYRMNKAKELLRYTSKRSSEISIEVGYKDPHYFSYLFKKTQGMTPTQYRNNEFETD